MAAQTESPPLIEGEIEEPMLPAPDEVVFRMRQAILDGEHWFEALLDAVARWRIPDERIGNRTYTYLIRGEAFDWLLLAERLLALICEDLTHGLAGELLDHVVAVQDRPIQAVTESSGDGGFARTHQPDEDDVLR